MTDTIDPITRQQIADFLPSAILKTLKSYEVFNENVDALKSSEFSTHHIACKAAIGHLELLLKMAKWAKIPEDQNNNQTLIDYLALAEKRIEEHKKQEI